MRCEDKREEWSDRDGNEIDCLHNGLMCNGLDAHIRFGSNDQGSGNNRVCHSGRRIGGDCNPGHSSVSAETSGTLGCDSERHGAALARYMRRTALPHTCDLMRVIRKKRGLCPPEMSRAREKRSKDRKGNKTRGLFSFMSSKGQATVEFAVVMVGFLAATAALGVVWRTVESGLLVEHAAAVASHHVQAVAPATVADIFLY